MRSRSSRTSALDDIGDQMAPVGSEPWAKWMLGQAKLRRHDLQVDVVGLQDLIRKLEKHGAWKALGFVSFEMLCLKELDLDEEEVELVKTAKKGRALGAVIETAKKAKPLAAHGGDRKSENADQGDNVTLKARGNAPDYLTARIARDRPDILEQMKAGEFPSVRQAAIAAGIVRERGIVYRLQRLWEKATKDQRDEFLNWVEAKD